MLLARGYAEPGNAEFDVFAGMRSQCWVTRRTRYVYFKDSYTYPMYSLPDRTRALLRTPLKNTHGAVAFTDFSNGCAFSTAAPTDAPWLSLITNLSSFCIIHVSP